MKAKVYWILFTLSILCFLLISISEYLYPKNNLVLRNINFPFGVVNETFLINNRIYIASSTYGRMQVYNLKGEFLYGFFIGSRVSTGYHDEVFHLINGITYYSQLDLEGNINFSKKIAREERSKYEQILAFKDNPDIEIVYNLFSNIILVNTSEGLIKLYSPWYWYLITSPLPLAIYFYLCVYLQFKFKIFHFPVFKSNYKISYLLKKYFKI